MHPANDAAILQKIEAALQEKEEIFRKILDTLPVGVFILNEDGSPYYANQMASGLLGRGILPPPGSGERPYPLFVCGTEEAYPRERMPIWRALSGEQSTVSDMAVHTPAGVQILQVWGSPIYGKAGGIAYAVAVLADISVSRDLERKQHLAAARTSHLLEFSRKLNETASLSERLAIIRQLFPGLADAGLFSLFLLEPGSQTLQLLCHNHPEWMGENPEGMPLDTSPLMRDTALARQPIFISEWDTSPFHGQARPKYLSGSALCVPLIFEERVCGLVNFNNFTHDLIDPIYLAHIEYLCLHMFLSINNAMLFQRTVELSTRDELTQTFNRRHMMQIMGQEMQRWERYQQTLSIIMLDIDYFKSINDTYGHAAGDFVLRRLASELRAHVRPMDWVCRCGGEEFAIILPNTSRTETAKLAERLRQHLAEYAFLYQGPAPIHITVSMGISEIMATDTVDTLLNRADKGLYRAKENGRNQCMTLN